MGRTIAMAHTAIHTRRCCIASTARSGSCWSVRAGSSSSSRATGWCCRLEPCTRRSLGRRAARASRAGADGASPGGRHHARRKMGLPMSIIEFIRDRARFYNCPVCGRSLKGCDIQVLSHEEERCQLQVTCAQCQVTFIVVLAIAGGAVEEIEAVEAADAVEAAPAREPISVDEILDLHLYLKNFQGTLKELIHQPENSRG